MNRRGKLVQNGMRRRMTLSSSPPSSMVDLVLYSIVSLEFDVWSRCYAWYDGIVQLLILVYHFRPNDF